MSASSPAWGNTAQDRFTADSLARLRLTRQRLTGSRLSGPGEAAAWLGAVQSQDYPGALWSLGLRMEEPNERDIERAFNEGAILRTHVLRPTWHFVLPGDICWMLELTAPRVKAAMAYMNRQIELDEAALARANEVIAAALEGGRALGRAALGKALEQAGIPVDGYRLGHILANAELDRVICSGPRQGKQFTYALLEERAPTARSLPREEALAALALRYFNGRGPASDRDFAWWSGLTLADARAAVELAGPALTGEEIEGKVYYTASSPLPAADEDREPPALLLPTYDEFLVGYAGFDKARRGGCRPFLARFLLGGRVAGGWRRALKKDAVLVEVDPFDPLSPDDEEALFAAAERYARFLGLPLQFEIANPSDVP